MKKTPKSYAIHPDNELTKQKKKKCKKNRHENNNEKAEKKPKTNGNLCHQVNQCRRIKSGEWSGYRLHELNENISNIKRDT